MNNKKKLLYIGSVLPSLTVTFIYREIFGLRQAGYEVETVSMNRPRESSVSQEARGLLETTHYLDQVPLIRKLFAFFKVALVKPAPFLECLRTFMRARPMQSFRDYMRLGYHFIEACYLYEVFKDRGVEHIHSHFINGPTSLSMFLAELLGVPFSFTMHASLIWLDPLALANKLEKCGFCVSISEYNKRYVLETYGQQYRDKINIVHCGIDPASMTEPFREPRAENAAFRLLGVAQLTERKGFHFLVQACALLRDKGLDFHCTIVGEGAQRPLLEKLIRDNDLGARVELAGARTQEQLPAYLAATDCFVLPCVIAKDGWRDGIPVALMEAMYWKIPVVSTRILGLPELIESGVDGVLVESEDVEGLSQAIMDLAGEPDTCRRLGENGVQKVLNEFNVQVSVRQLDVLFAADRGTA